MNGWKLVAANKMMLKVKQTVMIASFGQVILRVKSQVCRPNHTKIAAIIKVPIW